MKIILLKLLPHLVNAKDFSLQREPGSSDLSSANFVYMNAKFGITEPAYTRAYNGAGPSVGTVYMFTSKFSWLWSISCHVSYLDDVVQNEDLTAL